MTVASSRTPSINSQESVSTFGGKSGQSRRFRIFPVACFLLVTAQGPHALGDWVR